MPHTRQYIFNTLTVVSLVLMLLSGCSKSQDRAGVKTYEVVLKDDEGQEVASGTLDLPVAYPHNKQFFGKCQMNWTHQRANHYPFGGSKYSGKIEQKKIYIRLNPDAADHNIDFVGVLEEGAFAGNWYYLDDSGPEPLGTFRATVRK
jgi:hypothetical protein